MLPCWLAALCLSVCFAPLPAFAQAPATVPSSDVDRAEDAPDSDVEDRPLTDEPEARAWLEEASRAVAAGDVAAATSALELRPPDDPAAAVVRAALALRTGRFEDALAVLVKAAAADPLGEAALEAGVLLQRLGRDDDAEVLLQPLVAAATTGEAEGHGMARGARAAHALGAHRLANQLFREAVEALGDAPHVETAWGELFLATHAEPDAVKSFERALAAHPRHVPAMIGLARSLAITDPPAARAQASRALAIDAGAWDAHLVLADLALDTRGRDEARAALTAALAINPRAPEALALQAALAAVEDRPADVEAAAAAAHAINPGDARPWRVASEHLASHYRFDEAVAYARRAVAVNGDDAAARAALGMHLMRTGEEEEAQRHLELAFARDPFDVVTRNLLELLDHLQRFETVTAGDFVFKFHPGEAPILRELAPALAVEAMTAMAPRYGYQPSGPVLVELFPRHDDFAVRTLGLPGMIGALGACFGRVVTLDSPRAREPGAFHWGATLWHELAHVITLQLSNQRVPRWLTEGISVYEERLARPEWGRESEFDFVAGLDHGLAIPLATLNEGFSDPRRIVLAYQQASLVVEYLVERFGSEAIVRMLRAYGEGLDDEAVFARELKADAASLQAGFDAFVEGRYGAVRTALRVPDGVALDGVDSVNLQRLAAEHPGSYPLQFAAAKQLIAAGTSAAAVPLLERAVALVPIATGPEAPRRLLAAIARSHADPQRASALLAEELAHEHAGLQAARELAELAGAAGDNALGRLAHERIAEVWPYDGASHAALGRLSLADGNTDDALRRFRLALATGPQDMVAARTDYAEALLRTGREESAKEELIAALTDAPLYERAQSLLLSIVEGARPGGPR